MEGSAEANVKRLALWMCAVVALPEIVRAQGKEGILDAVSAVGGAAHVGVAPEADGPEAALARIRSHIQALLSKRQPELFARHLNSVLALCEEDVLKLQFAGTHRDEQAKELLGYLRVIETGFSDDGDKPETYLVEGKRSLTLARLSRSDGTLQFYTVSLPPHWDPKKAYPLHVGLHGRGPDVPLAYVHYTFLPHEKDERRPDEVISIVPWLRGNGQWRNENGSEPDIWEAIDDVRSFAELDPDRWYISGHSWGGDDVWAIVQRTPDLWAAAGIMAGDPGSAPSDLGLLPNARYVPFCLWLGDQDPIPSRRPAFEYFRDALTAVGDPPKLVVAHGVGHNPRPEDNAALRSWLFEHVRRRPDHFSFVIDTPQHRGVWGISIPQKYPSGYGNVEPRVGFECWIEGSSVRIQAPDAKMLYVDLGPSGLNISGSVTLIVNGKTRFTGFAPAKPLSLDL
jgi:pimeloyl-ACP methyl ester carboxylesterase